MSLGSANVLITVIFPCSTSFLCSYGFKHALTSSILESMLSLSVRVLLVEKVIPKAFVLFDDHWNAF